MFREAQSKFIVLEGLDGAGKSTVLDYLCSTLNAQPFAMPPGAMRGIKAYVDKAVSYPAQLCYYIACIIHLSDLIRSSLRQSSVICHRFYPSLVANQCYVSKMTLSTLESMITPFQSYILKPDATIFLCATAAECRRRLMQRPNKVQGSDVLLLQSDDYVTTVNSVYDELRNRDPNWFDVVTTGRHVETVCSDALQKVISL